MDLCKGVLKVHDTDLVFVVRLNCFQCRDHGRAVWTLKIRKLHNCHWSVRSACGWTSLRRYSCSRRLCVADSGFALHDPRVLGLRLAECKRRDSEKTDP